MKNKSFYAIIVLVWCISSCKKDFISLTPQTQLSSATYFKTADQFQQALTGVYQALRGWAEPSSWLMGETRSDNTRYDYNPLIATVAGLERQSVADWTDDAYNSTTKTKYTSDYTGIERANIILDQIANAKIDSTIKNTITGESEVLRAFFYFDLVQFYGGVPLNVHTVSNPSQAFLPRSPVEDVYAQIITDLKDAITKLPQKVTFSQTGHVTIGTAETLLANVYMVQKKFDQAATLLQAVTQLGYSLNANYANAFSTTNKNSAESIFEVQYKQGAADGQWSAFIYDFIPPMVNSTIVTGTNTNTTSLPSGQNLPTADLVASYEPGDKRLDASIGVIVGHYDATATFVADSVVSIVGYPHPVPSYTGPGGVVSKLFVKKYLHPSTTPFQTDDDWPIYRYSEALLMLAESLNEQGKSMEALPYLNQVRVRAGLPPSTETDQTLLRVIIAHERRIELAFENKRWTDLLRTGQVIPGMTAFSTTLKQNNPNVPANAYNLATFRLLFPIPETEIQLNPKITQNPGY